MAGHFLFFLAFCISQVGFAATKWTEIPRNQYEKYQKAFNLVLPAEGSCQELEYFSSESLYYWYKTQMTTKWDEQFKLEMNEHSDQPTFRLTAHFEESENEAVDNELLITTDADYKKIVSVRIKQVVSVTSVGDVNRGNLKHPDVVNEKHTTVLEPMITTCTPKN